ncbi:MAG TPA: GAF domain-containing SpoIIE family protein phosphatase [Phycisphaerae bacterium]|nr:GAF domain-containing SpoIIE family protein phosphatase [Phycisphaerae bacterium]
MADLNEYLDAETLRQLAAVFADVAGVGVRISSPDGTLLAGPEEPVPAATEMRIMLGGLHVGTIGLAGGGAPHPAETVRLLGLMRDMLTRLTEQAHQLRERIEELAAVYRLTEVFTGRTDLDEVHRLVAEAMVQATGADACSIRLFNPDRTELLRVAAHGLTDAYLGKGPLHVSDSQIDREVLATGRCVYIPDERTDGRVLYKDEAQREGIVSALCAPMTYKGRIEGIIRVYTKRPHEFDWFETSLICRVADQAAAAIVNARLYNEALEGARMRRQLLLASEIQQRMIPPAPPRREGLDLAVIYVPCFEVGGDFYDFLEMPDGNLGVCVADVMGKGVPASLLMASVRASLRAHAAHVYALSDVLAHVNRDLLGGSPESDFVTMFYGVIDVPRRRLTYCSAGHEPSLLIRDGRAETLRANGGLIGILPEMTFRHDVLELRSGDVLVICTDGVPEAMNFDEEMFDRHRVREAALAAVGRGENARGVANHILWELRRFAGLQTRGDDLTLVVIRVQ